MAGSAQEQEALKSMISSFKLSELQTLLAFAGRNSHGKKHDLQNRALNLLNFRYLPLPQQQRIQSKIREIYKAAQATESASTMMGQGGGMNYPGMGYANMTAAAMMGLTSAYGGQSREAALSLQGRNPFTAATTHPQAPGYPAAPPNLYNTPYQVQPTRQVPVHPDVKFIELPFYDVHAELLRPASLLSHGNNRFQDASFQFFLTPGQATDIASNRDIRMGSKMEYLYQIQLRFCPLSLEPNKEMSDEFPPSVCVQVNGKMAQLPNPIPTNKPGVEPKRPPRPVNITPLCKLTPILPNNISIKWAAEYGKGWVVGIWLVMKLTSDDLLERLKKKGSRKPEFTRSLIIEKLKDDDCDVATTSLKVSVACPLGKMRMALPCRPSTCSHLQCFDASLFLQMNERKPTWTCPVCDSKALYDTLMIDGYFQDVIKSDKLPRDDNEIILEEDGEWRPVPKEEAAQEKPKEAAPKPTEEEVDCIDLSDDEDIPLPPTAAPPPLPPQMALDQPPPPPPPPQEIECIDLE